MTIVRHYHVGETLQRSLVHRNDIIYRRIAAWVTPDGEIDNVPERAVWQVRIHTGDFHNVVGTPAEYLESEFITALIAANGLDKS